mmetsp:Transcript_645/g.696  ORF Transcript_645/g.696 Transcript_645/m.696 type:complete len:175 (+) Transcript_645:143-667(+)
MFEPLPFSLMLLSVFCCLSCNINQTIETGSQTPPVGCTYKGFNFAVNAWITAQTNLIEAIDNLSIHKFIIGNIQKLFGSLGRGTCDGRGIIRLALRYYIAAVVVSIFFQPYIIFFPFSRPRLRCRKEFLSRHNGSLTSDPNWSKRSQGTYQYKRVDSIGRRRYGEKEGDHKACN